MKFSPVLLGTLQKLFQFYYKVWMFKIDGLDLMMPQDELYARVCADLTAPSAEKQREVRRKRFLCNIIDILLH
jgi:hypothetical protein